MAKGLERDATIGDLEGYEAPSFRVNFLVAEINGCPKFSSVCSESGIEHAEQVSTLIGACESVLAQLNRDVQQYQQCLKQKPIAREAWVWLIERSEQPRKSLMDAYAPFKKSTLQKNPLKIQRHF